MALRTRQQKILTILKQSDYLAKFTEKGSTIERIYEVSIYNTLSIIISQPSHKMIYMQSLVLVFVFFIKIFCPISASTFSTGTRTLRTTRR